MKFVYAIWLVLCLPACTTNTLPQEPKVVYITQSGSRYHVKKCRYLAKSSLEVTIGEAQERGYTPCSFCLSAPADTNQ